MLFVLPSTLMRGVCVQALYSTLVDLNDIALWLFIMGAELNEKTERGARD